MDLGVIEICTKRKNNPLFLVGRVLLIAAAVILLGMALLLLMSSSWIPCIIAALLGAAAIVGAVFVSNEINLDFELSLVDRELRIAKIINRERRKKVGTFDLEKLEILAPEHSHRLDALRERSLEKKVDCSSHDPARAQYVYLCYLEGSTCIRLELDELDEKDSACSRFLNAVRMFAPRKVYTD